MKAPKNVKCKDGFTQWIEARMGERNQGIQKSVETRGQLEKTMAESLKNLWENSAKFPQINQMPQNPQNDYKSTCYEPICQLMHYKKFLILSSVRSR